ncbi:hypothetical protein GCM10009827_113150 [Dactylosporangium maewongense]|uniref:Uncharacterized protein n=1 Tax=Dactylosporangium maewongense TaxID=634393 RepID=A0ABP4P2U0_9ACTN
MPARSPAVTIGWTSTVRRQGSAAALRPGGAGATATARDTTAPAVSACLSLGVMHRILSHRPCAELVEGCLPVSLPGADIGFLTVCRRFESCRGHVTELQNRSAFGRSLIVDANFAL